MIDVTVTITAEDRDSITEALSGMENEFTDDTLATIRYILTEVSEAYDEKIAIMHKGGRL